MGPRLGERPGLLVGALRGQRIEHVGDGDDAAAERDRLALQARRVALPVEALVVGGGDLGREPHEL
jgi:hypothetical protein